MKLVAGYLELAAMFGRMAAEAENPDLKARLLKQSDAYRGLAAKRAADTGLPPPPPAACPFAPRCPLAGGRQHHLGREFDRQFARWRTAQNLVHETIGAAR